MIRRKASRQRRYQILTHQNGRCPRCGGRREHELRGYCDRCLSKRAEETNRLYETRRGKGICVSCPEPASPGKARCEKCAERHRQYKKKHRRVAKMLRSPPRPI